MASVAVTKHLHKHMQYQQQHLLKSGLIPAERTVETLSIVVETKVSEANCRFFSPAARFFFEIRVS
jgi:hypothetical protein